MTDVTFKRQTLILIVIQIIDPKISAHDIGHFSQHRLRWSGFERNLHLKHRQAARITKLVNKIILNAITLPHRNIKPFVNNLLYKDDLNLLPSGEKAPEGFHEGQSLSRLQLKEHHFTAHIVLKQHPFSVRADAG